VDVYVPITMKLFCQVKIINNAEEDESVAEGCSINVSGEQDSLQEAWHVLLRVWSHILPQASDKETNNRKDVLPSATNITQVRRHKGSCWTKFFERR
jgi:hypothetical protein